MALVCGVSFGVELASAGGVALLVAAVSDGSAGCDEPAPAVGCSELDGCAASAGRAGLSLDDALVAGVDEVVSGCGLVASLATVPLESALVDSLEEPVGTEAVLSVSTASRPEATSVIPTGAASVAGLVGAAVCVVAADSVATEGCSEGLGVSGLLSGTTGG